jgi:hypothetical protein
MSAREKLIEAMTAGIATSWTGAYAGDPGDRAMATAALDALLTSDVFQEAVQRAQEAYWDKNEGLRKDMERALRAALGGNDD